MFSVVILGFSNFVLMENDFIICSRSFFCVYIHAHVDTKCQNKCQTRNVFSVRQGSHKRECKQYASQLVNKRTSWYSLEYKR